MSDETHELSRVLGDHLSVKDKDGHVMLQVAQLATVYFEAPYRQEIRNAVASCCDDYLRRWGQHLRWALHPDRMLMDRFGAGKASNPQAWLPAMGEDESFELIYHGAEHERGASAFSLQALGNPRRPYVNFGFLRVSFPLLCFADGSGSLPEVLLDLCRALKPISGYGGIGVIESPDSVISSGYEPIVYGWAQRLPGLEADNPIWHAIALTKGREGGRDGIKGGNWLTVLGDRYVVEMGGTDRLEADLRALDDRFLVHRYDGGVLIQAGPRPQLGDAERNLWPALYVKLAKYLKPLRVTRHMEFHCPAVRQGANRGVAAPLR